MKILLDCRYQRGAGPNITSDYLLDELLRVDTHHQYFILQLKNQRLSDYRGVKKIFVPALSRWAEFLWIQVVLPWVIKRQRIDLYHSLKHFGPLFAPVPVILPVRAVSQFLEGMQELSATDTFYWRHVGRLAWKRATHIVAVSGVCRDVLVSQVGISEKKIQVIHHGVHSKFRPLSRGDIPQRFLQRFGLDGRFLLCVGNPYPHKNYDTAVRVLWRLRQILPETHRYKLAIVGDPMYVTPSLRKLIKDLELEKDIVFTDFVSHDDLVYLYNAAELLLFCSLYEAFPNPIVESMACGLPVIAANRGAVAEVAGRGAQLVENAEDHDAFADAAKTIIESATHRDALVSAGLDRAKAFQWDRTAHAVLQIYDRLSERLSA